MGPLFFLVLLVPFTLNGIAVREAFFVSFLGSVGVAADAAFAAGFLFFLVTTALALPGRGDPPLGGPARRLAAAARAWLTRAGSRASSSRTTRCPGSSSASRASRRSRRSSSTTARADGTVGVVRERFPAVRLVEAENRGARGGLEPRRRGDLRRVRADPERRRLARRRRCRATGRRGRPAPERRGRRPAAPQPDGTLQRSVRGFPTLWRLATEYLYLRKLAPRSRALNAFYAGGFDHDAERDGRVGDGLLHARPPRRVRRGRPVRRALLPLQRGGRLDAARHRSRLVGPLHADGRVRPRRRRLARRPALPGERPRAPAVPLAPRPARRGGAARAGSCAPRCSCEGGCIVASAGASTARWATWLGSGDVETLIAGSVR